MNKNFRYFSGCLDDVERRGEFTFGEHVIEFVEINFQRFSLHGTMLRHSQYILGALTNNRVPGSHKNIFGF